MQMEPVWGGSGGHRGLLRAAAILALGRIDEEGLRPLLVDSVVDPEKEVRIAAAQALGYHGSETAALLLRLKANLGDREPEVLSECLSALLAVRQEVFPLVVRYLDRDEIPACEAAILALGRYRGCPKASTPCEPAGTGNLRSCSARRCYWPWSCFAFRRPPISSSARGMPPSPPPLRPSRPSRSTPTTRDCGRGSPRPSSAGISLHWWQIRAGVPAD